MGEFFKSWLKLIIRKWYWYIPLFLLKISFDFAEDLLFSVVKKVSMSFALTEFLKNYGWVLSWIIIPFTIIGLLIKDYVAAQKTDIEKRPKTEKPAGVIWFKKQRKQDTAQDSTIQELKKQIEKYRNLVLLCVYNPEVLEGFRNAQNEAEIPLIIQNNCINTWNILHDKLPDIIDTLDRITGEKYKRFRYEFTTRILKARRFIEDPTVCIDYVYCQYNSLSYIDKQLAPISNIQTQVQQKIIEDLQRQENEYFSSLERPLLSN